MFLYHYFDKTTGAFTNLSDLPIDKANTILENIKTQKPNSQSATRHPEYMEQRYRNENKLKTLFMQKGGVVKRCAPHYMTIEHSPWLSTWHEDSGCIKISIDEFDTQTISFTYGDMFPVFNTLEICIL